MVIVTGGGVERERNARMEWIGIYFRWDLGAIGGHHMAGLEVETATVDGRREGEVGRAVGSTGGGYLAARQNRRAKGSTLSSSVRAKKSRTATESHDVQS